LPGEGQVLDETGHPLADAIVAAYDGHHLLPHAKSDPKAAYRIDGLRPGRYPGAVCQAGRRERSIRRGRPSAAQ
jgi:protocatechuate 3,4-dioxygenase beta subunit